MNSDALPRLLSRISYFKGLDEPTLGNLAGYGKFIKYPKDSFIFKQKEKGSSLYLIVLGRVKIIRVEEPNQIKVNVLDKFNSFGELSFFDGDLREFTAVADTEVVLFYIERDFFKVFLKDNPESALSIIENLTLSLRKEKSLPKQPEHDEMNDLMEIPIEETVQKDSNANPEMDRMLYKKDFLCPCCAHKFATSKVRSRFIKVVKVDDDLCNHYESVNPLFYEILVCPKCGYSFHDENGGHIDSKTREEIYKRLPASWRKKDYTGVRDIEQATESFKLAIACQMARRSKDSQKGMLYLKLGWLYRVLDDQKNENICISEAAKFLTSSFEKEQFADPKSEINVLYLIGVLNRKMGNYKEASLWLDRVLRHPMKDSFSGVVNRARESWQILRNEMKEATN